ncbi:hypothetical protein [Lentzea sp. NPDC092896]|uniref:hypothetical protein n=1 Tax=Lentzea sp. NPDC092896 TaxID=3364127 RepID=UPI0037F44D95
MLRKVIFVLVVLLGTGGTGVAAAQDGAEVEVFWDRNRDGVRQADEPPFAHAYFSLTNPNFRGYPDTAGYPMYTDDHGLAKLEPRPWAVAFPEDKYVVTTRAVAAVDPGDRLVIGVHGAAICGTAWLDENADGQRQDGERLIGGHEIQARHPVNVGGERTAFTADDGTYCFRDLPVDHYQLTSADRLGIDKTTWGVAHWRSDDADEDQVSKFDVADGKSKVLKVDVPGTDIDDVDTAFVKADQNTVEPLGITVVNPDGSTFPRDLAVGERIKVIGEFRARGPAHDSYNGSLHLPEGLKILGTEGIPAEVRERNLVEVGFPDRRAPEQVERVVVIAEVETAFPHREVSLTAVTERVTVQIRALGSEPAKRARTVPWDMVITLVLLLMVVFTVWWLRRRRTRS